MLDSIFRSYLVLFNLCGNLNTQLNFGDPCNAISMCCLMQNPLKVSGCFFLKMLRRFTFCYNIMHIILRLDVSICMCVGVGV